MAWLVYAILEFQFVKFMHNEELIQTKETSTTLSMLQAFIFTTFVYPLLEEVVFRLPLRVKLSNVVVSLLAATWYFSFRSDLFSVENSTILIYKLFGALLVSVFVILFFFKSKYVEMVLQALGNRYHVPLVMTSVFLFSLAHLWKISYESLFYATLFIFVAYFIFGLFLSYVRIRLNFWVALFFHILHNSIPYLIVLYYSIKRGENLFLYV